MMTTTTTTTTTLIVISFCFCLIPSLIVPAGSASSFLHQETTSTTSTTTCGYSNHDDVLMKYHVDEACDRQAQNAVERRQLFLQRAADLHQAGDISQVPEEKTITCPVTTTTGSGSSSSTSMIGGYENDHQHQYHDHRHLGFYTTWLVENTSTLPVVVAYVDHPSGIEYSALNSDIAPPLADPNAILMPREWKSIRAMEGHVFHVYELLGGGEGDTTYQLGRLVLQHRVGLIPIRNRFATLEETAFTCGGDASGGNGESGGEDVVDDETDNVVTTETKTPSLLTTPHEEPYELVHEAERGAFQQVGKAKLVEQASASSWHHQQQQGPPPPPLQRTAPNPNEHCNALYRGFRNLVGCPVQAYYIGQSLAYQSKLASLGILATSFDGADSMNHNNIHNVESMRSCPGEFKFHLGINEHANDFENDWDSTTKFETSFVSHTYVFRLASNTSVMVDYHTLMPTRVVDCPRSDKTAASGRQGASIGTAESTVLPLGAEDDEEQDDKDADETMSVMIHKLLHHNITMTMNNKAVVQTAPKSKIDMGGVVDHESHNHSLDRMQEAYMSSSSSSLVQSHV